MGFPMPKLDKPGDILTLLANPEKYKEYAERLIFLREEAESKLGDLSSRDVVDQYVRDKRQEANKLAEDAAKERQRTSAALEVAERNKKLIAEQLEVAIKARESIEAGRHELEKDRQALAAVQQAFQADVIKIKDARKQREADLAAQESRVAAKELWVQAFVASINQQVGKMP